MSLSRSHTAQSDRRGLLRVLALVWCLVLVSISLYPFEGWRLPAHAPWDFLTQPLPRYRTPFDLWSNLLAYMPLGCLIAGSRLPTARASWSILLTAILLAALLSLGMEMTQAFLPSRRSQWLDILANVSGASLGALIWLGLFRRQAPPSPSMGLPRTAGSPPWLRLGALLVLLLVWSFAQASPMPVWLSMGVSPFWSLGPWLLVANESGWHILLEALMVGFSLSVLVLLIVCSSPASDSRWGQWVHRHPSAAIGLTLAGALLVRLTWVSLLGAPNAQALSIWLSPGVQAGLVLASLLSAAVISLGPLSRALVLIILLAFSLLLSQAVSLLGPLLLEGWASGPWLNLRGLAQASAAIWPFLALAWATVLLLQSHNRRL